ncbi:MAG: GNAT family N-acetyltransferase [Acidimicrobiales bacterium]
MLAVDPPAQVRGVGRALLDACIERARQLGRAGLFLHSTPWMEAAPSLRVGRLRPGARARLAPCTRGAFAVSLGLASD